MPMRFVRAALALAGTWTGFASVGAFARTTRRAR